MPTELVLHALLWLLCTLGFVLLAWAMHGDHSRPPQAGSNAPARLLLRCLACALLLAASILAIREQGAGLGLVSWTGHVSLGAACTYLGRIIVMALKNRPRVTKQDH